MSRTGRPKTELILTDEEREQLLRWSRRPTSAQALALRSRIILGCAEGLDNKSVAARVGCSTNTVSKWRARFVASHLDGLVDEPRPGRPASISADQVEEVVVATLESTPKNATHWSRAKMAERSGLSKSTIGRVWKAFELKPHRQNGFKLSNDPQFVEKVYGHSVISLKVEPHPLHKPSDPLITNPSNPPNEYAAIGTGIGTFTPTIPTSMSNPNPNQRQAARPNRPNGTAPSSPSRTAHASPCGPAHTY